mmetsp:Transcript_2248/g.2520  ORF Transcript_2248/g.2520 Transcript_2248/m.2520 type:complete len:245 (-) Transcript_2248:169-903(-)
MTSLMMRSKWAKVEGDSDSESSCDWDDSDSECDWLDDRSDVASGCSTANNDDRLWMQALRHTEQIEEMPKGVPVEIIPGKLYIGDSDCVREEYREQLHKQKITAVLNMAGNKETPADPTNLAREWKEKADNGTFLYKAIEADDVKTYPLLENHWTEAKEFLDNAIITQNRACLVHCVAGQNRSGLIVCAFYMLYKQINILEAVEYVRSRRGTEVLKNKGFQHQLIQLAKAEKCLGSEPIPNSEQ